MAKQRNGRVTFSISGHTEDPIGRMHALAGALGVHVVSAIRHEISALEAVLQEAEGQLTTRERAGFKAAVELLSFSYLVQVEGVPSRDQLCAYANSAGRSDVAGFLNTSTTTRLLLVVDRARRKRLSDQMSGAEEVGGKHAEGRAAGIASRG